MWTEFYSSHITPEKLLSILEQGGDPNGYKGDNIMQPPLHMCCARREPIRMLEILLEHGADPNLIHDRHSPLHLAARRGDVERMRVLLRHGANPDLPDTKGWTPLHLAFLFPEAVKFLIEYGADTGLETRNGETLANLLGKTEE